MLKFVKNQRFQRRSYMLTWNKGSKSKNLGQNSHRKKHTDGYLDKSKCVCLPFWASQIHIVMPWPEYLQLSAATDLGTGDRTVWNTQFPEHSCPTRQAERLTVNILVPRPGYLPLSAATDLGGGIGDRTVWNTAPWIWLSS